VRELERLILQTHRDVFDDPDFARARRLELVDGTVDVADDSRADTCRLDHSWAGVVASSTSTSTVITSKGEGSTVWYAATKWRKVRKNASSIGG